VLKIAKTSNAFDNFIEKICARIKETETKTPNTSSENRPTAEEITKNQNDNPSATVSALNLGEDNFILNRIN